MSPGPGTGISTRLAARWHFQHVTGKFFKSRLEVYNLRRRGGSALAHGRAHITWARRSARGATTATVTVTVDLTGRRARQVVGL